MQTMGVSQAFNLDYFGVVTREESNSAMCTAVAATHERMLTYHMA